MRRKLLLFGLLLLVLAGIAAGGYAYYRGPRTPPRYLTAQVERGQITMTVNATGTVNAVVTVQVGSQVSGIIQKLFADYNSPVKEDTRDPSRGGGPGRAQEIQQRLTQALALSSEQQTRLGDILQQSRQRFLALREENLAEEQRRTRGRELQAQSRTQIRTILTTEQLQKYEELLKARDDAAPPGRPGRVWVLSADGTLQPHTLTLGMSNDTHTEVLSGDLSVGQQVITGVLTSTKAPARPSTPGFGTRPF